MAKTIDSADPRRTYCVLSFVDEECEQPREAMKWAIERRSQGRRHVEAPKTKAEHRERHEQLVDLLEAWRHGSRSCGTPGVPPCPPPPFPQDEIDAIDAREAKLHPGPEGAKSPQ